MQHRDEENQKVCQQRGHEILEMSLERRGPSIEFGRERRWETHGFPFDSETLERNARFKKRRGFQKRRTFRQGGTGKPGPRQRRLPRRADTTRLFRLKACWASTRNCKGLATAPLLRNYLDAGLLDQGRTLKNQVWHER